MLNETVLETVNALTPTGVVWWLKILALCGLVWMIQLLGKTGISFIYLFAYILGFLKWILNKIKGKH